MTTTPAVKGDVIPLTIVHCPCTAINLTECEVSDVECWNCHRVVAISEPYEKRKFECETVYQGMKPSLALPDSQNPNVTPF